MTYDGTDANDDGIVEADIDNESISTVSIGFDHASITRTEEIVGFAEDADGGTNLSMTINNIDEFEQLVLVVEVDGQGGGAEGDINIQMGGASLGYAQTTLASSVSTATGLSEYHYTVWNAAQERHEFVVPNKRTCTIRQLTPPDERRDMILRGDNGSSNCTSITVSSGFAAKGSMYIKEVRDI